MLGAIIGDIAGSTYEVDEVKSIKTGIPYEKRIKILDRSVPLFLDNSSYTDDSVLTTAIADCILRNGDYEDYLRKYGLQELNLGLDIYGRNRFGKGFVDWLNKKTSGESFGNGCAMRISPIPNYFNSLEDVLEETKKATIPSHNHQDSLNASLAVVLAIKMAKEKKTKQEIKMVIEKECSYCLNYSLEYLQRNYRFTSKASDSVPQAIYCFLESIDFEDAIRKAISIGGDTDTIAAITGSIAEAYYGIPIEIINDVWKYLPDYIKKVVNRFYLQLELLSFFKEENMNNKIFLDYIKPRVKKLPSYVGKEWFGCFEIVNADNVLTDIKLVVPEIENIDNLLVNIHEYTHAFDLFQKLGSTYEVNTMMYERYAMNKEKEYIKKLGVNKWIK